MSLLRILLDCYKSYCRNFGDGEGVVDAQYISLNKLIYFFLHIKFSLKSIAKISGVKYALILFLNIWISKTAFVYEVENKILLAFDQFYIGRDIRNIKKLSLVVEKSCIPVIFIDLKSCAFCTE